MSCSILPHKKAIDNLKEQIIQLNIPNIPLGNKISPKAFIAHNNKIKEQVQKIIPVIDSWNKAVAQQLGPRPSVVESLTKYFDGDRDTPFGLQRKYIKIKFNTEVLDEIDNYRKSLGIYEDKIPLAVYLQEKNKGITFEEFREPGFYNEDTALEEQEENDFNQTTIEIENFPSINISC